MGYVSDWEKKQLTSIKFITKKQMQFAIKQKKNTSPAYSVPAPKLKSIKIESINVRPRQSKLVNVFNIRKIIRRTKFE